MCRYRTVATEEVKRHRKALKVLPFLVDPIGAVFRVPFSPGGALRDAVDPRREEPRPEPKRPVVTGGRPGSLTVRQQPAPAQPAAKVEEDEFQRRRAGAGGSEDVTRGLIRSRSGRGLVA